MTDQFGEQVSYDEFGTPVAQKKSNTTMIIIIVVVVLLCCCCVASTLTLYFGFDPFVEFLKQNFGWGPNLMLV